MTALAKLSDVKTLRNWSGSELDTLLTTLLERASSKAEQLVGVANGNLRRQTGIVEYPRTKTGRCVGDAWRLYLKVLPIESITSIVQLYGNSTDAEFDAQHAADPLVEDEDYLIDSALFGSVERLDIPWTLGPRYVRVTYTGGWADPNDALPAGASYPPDDLQQGVIAQALMLYDRRDVHAADRIDAGRAGGASVSQDPVHDDLASVCQALKRIRI